MPPHASSCRVQLVFHTWTLVRAKLAALEPSPGSAVPSLNAAAIAVRASSGQKLLEEHPCAWQQDHLLRGVARLGAAGMEGTLHCALPFIELPVPLSLPRGYRWWDQPNSLPGPSWTCNKLLASAVFLHPHPWGQGGAPGARVGEVGVWGASPGAGQVKPRCLEAVSPLRPWLVLDGSYLTLHHW